MWILIVAVLTVVFIYGTSRLDVPAQQRTSVERALLNVFVPALLLVSLLWRTSFGLLLRFGGKTLVEMREAVLEPRVRGG